LFVKFFIWHLGWDILVDVYEGLVLGRGLLAFLMCGVGMGHFWYIVSVGIGLV
jgi:hypothetical protein